MDRPLGFAAFCAAAVFVVTAGTAGAQVTRSDAACRSAVWKSAAKLGATAMKTVDACLKQQLADRIATSIDCNDVEDADLKDKVAKVGSKLASAIPRKCDGGQNALALAQYASCPSPGQAVDDGEATTAIDSFAEVALCQAALNIGYVEPLRRYVLAPDAAAVVAADNGRNIARCASAIAKSASKLWKTVSKERGKCQTKADKAAGPYTFSCASFDDNGKIAAASLKLTAAVEKSCSELSVADLAQVGSCAATASGIAACATAAVTKNASGLTTNAFEHRGVCPQQLRLVTKPGNADGARVGPTDLDFGWTGFSHEGDFFEGFATRFELACATGDCESCAISAACDEDNCRCSNDSSISCNSPFTAGGSCGAGTCVVYFGPPRPRSVGGIPACVLDSIASPLAGVADAGAGTLETTWQVTARVHLGITQTRPCPDCSGSTIGAAGMCNGGARNGQPCTTDAIDPDFGAMSYDCPPDPAAHVTGPDGLLYDLTLSDAPVSLAAGDACEVAGHQCPCGACSGDPTIVCTDDAACSGLGAGTCTDGGGKQRSPNSCSDLVCTPLEPGSDQGICADGPIDHFCDGFLRANGEGYVTCDMSNGDADCTPLSAGSCSLSRPRRCFLDPITTSGSAGHSGGVLAGITCVPPASLASVNSASGLPGPFRMRLDVDYTALCADGVTEYELGGAPCP